MKRARELEDDVELSVGEQDVAFIPVPKIINIDIADQQDTGKLAMECSLPGHAPCMTFNSYSEHEQHYNNHHTNRCLECWKNFPSAHLMNLHISEFHNTLAQIRKEKGEPIFDCFVETCGETFQTSGKRQTHLVKNHMYPKDYFFAVTKFGIDRRQSMLVDYVKKGRKEGRETRPERSNSPGKVVEAFNFEGDSPEKDTPMSEAVSPGVKTYGAGTGSNSPRLKAVVKADPMEDKAHPQEAGMCVKASMCEAAHSLVKKDEAASSDTVMDDLTGAMSSLKFVPRTIRLKAKQKTGTVRR